MVDGKRYIIVIPSYCGKNTSRLQEGGESQPYNERLEDYPGDMIYAVVTVDSKGAEIVDDGYRSYTEAKAAWPEAI